MFPKKPKVCKPHRKLPSVTKCLLFLACSLVFTTSRGPILAHVSIRSWNMKVNGEHYMWWEHPSFHRNHQQRSSRVLEPSLFCHPDWMELNKCILHLRYWRWSDSPFLFTTRSNRWSRSRRQWWWRSHQGRCFFQPRDAWVLTRDMTHTWWRRCICVVWIRHFVF